MQKLSLLILLLVASLSFAQSPHGKNFDIDCEECHSTEKWDIDYSKLKFNHSITDFELVGQHKSLDCRNCHTTIVFSEIDQQCSSCHTDMHQNTVGNDCAQCHTSESWLVKDITEIHMLGRFPLVGAHKLANCEDCHSSSSKLLFEPIGIECIDCHISDYQSAKFPDHVAVGFSNDCQECHQVTDLAWSKANITHDFFPLIGGHKISNCFDCHNQNTFEGLTQECYVCHQSDYNSVTEPNHVNNNFSTDCSECHTTNPNWRPASFTEHDNIFQLVGAHKLIENDCSKCHSTGYSNTPSQCYDCHKNNYDNTTNPSHQSAGFGTNCESCHNSNAWQPASFDHDNQFFPIYAGKHNNKWNECSDCHTNSANYQVFECITCHEHNQSEMNDEHSEINGYIYESSACYTCHPTGDSDGGFNHSTTTFPLTGSHISVQCSDCHSNGYQGTSTECSSCHINDYQNSANPNHQQLGLAQNCEVCHTTNPDWQPANFAVHNEFYLLDGAHSAVANDCNTCHSGDYVNNKNLCADCHISNYNNSVNPNHQQLALEQNCETCHTTNPGWEPATFAVHNEFYLIEGAHTAIANECSSCHAGDYVNTGNLCIDCHRNDYNSTADPNHQSTGFGTDCETCHSQNAWKPATFDHDNQFFPIYSGKHNDKWNECSDCHTNSANYQVFECITCHEHNQTEMDDKHSGVQGYLYVSSECLACHPTGNEEGAFNHATSLFPLTGAHTTAQCSDCHTSGYKETSNICSDCHINDYQNSANPNHQQLGLEQNCEVCHSTNPNWEPASFTIHNDFYMLEGAHSSISNDCSTCHAGDYINTGNLCIDCHSSNYNNTNDPNHQSTGFGTDCETCHSQNSWKPATFDHDNQFFPIYSGKHNEKWDQCSDCHTNTSNYQIFECINCHEHNQSEMNDKHSGVQGYVYISTECLACHPTGDDEGAFNHASSLFPLTGEHASQECSACHTSGYSNTSSECSECHQTNFNNTANPNHTAAGIPITCEDCHNSNGWKPSTFNHASTGFELVGGHNRTQCSDCHSVSTANATSECYVCHQTNYEAAPEHTSQGYPTACENCHNTTSWQETTFDHNTTIFALTGAHATTSCSNCHSSGYAGTSTVCNDCHQSNFVNASIPNHTNAGISNQCEECHTTSSWKPSTFNHTTTGFELVGGHNRTQCSDCHSVSTSNATSECYVCHQTNYDAAPEHTSQGYPTTCESCHNTTSWQETTFDHNTTNFALTGAHASTSCSSCHSSGYAGTSTVCSDCHIGDYNNSTNPSHTSLGLSTSCDACHSTNPNWEPASFSVHNDFYVLEGAHSSISYDCATCHNGNYNSTPNTCYQCHDNDYNSTTDPAHQSTGFGTDCEDCHTQNAWEPSTFDHDAQYFPINTGAHNEKWQSCSDCHTNQSNFAQFSCFNCHTHNQTKMDNKHREVSGYSYDSYACYDCHPNGKSDSNIKIFFDKIKRAVR